MDEHCGAKYWRCLMVELLWMSTQTSTKQPCQAEFGSDNGQDMKSVELCGRQPPLHFFDVSLGLVVPCPRIQSRLPGLNPLVRFINFSKQLQKGFYVHKNTHRSDSDSPYSMSTSGVAQQWKSSFFGMN
eukprot:m.316733 g.316733  ORF g.316733 m.316733 type:complete len:129 (+) comp16426_c2_seq8:1473-1859(+)